MAKVSPSSHPGMGAIPYQDGTTFRVWAPHAQKVYVTGTFNDWSERANRLGKENNAYWSVDVPGAKVGDQYKFLLVNKKKKLFRIDPYAKVVTSSVGNAIVQNPEFDWESNDFELPPLPELLIYEMHIGTFNDTPGGPPGNLHTAIKKLPYLKDLGINAIELMPLMEFAGGYSWGYNPAHIFSVESDYGGSLAFKEFIKTAHQLGIAVILDVVYNHFGPSDLDLWQFDGWSENDKGGIYFYNDWRAQTPWGDTRPDYGREEVRNFIRDNVMMWLTEYHIDGLRWDMTAFIRNVYGHNNDPDNDIPEGWSLMQWINQEIKAKQLHKICIAEDLQTNHFITKPVEEGGAGFDSQWEAQFVHPIRAALTAANDQERNMDAMRDALLHRYNDNPFQRIVYTESHDEVANGKARLPEEITPGEADSWLAKKLSMLGAALVFTAPGIPMIFQGQEFLEDEWFRVKDPIDWSKKSEFKGILQFYRDLIALRLNHHENSRGLCGPHIQVSHLNQQNKLLAFHRWENGGTGDSVMIVVNMANQNVDNYQIGFPAAGQWKVRLNSDWSGYDESFSDYYCGDVLATEEPRDDLPGSGNIRIGAYSVLILSQEG